MKQVLFYIILFFSITAGFTQNENRVFESAKKKNGVLTIKVNDGKYVISSYAPEIVETTFIPKGETYNNKSHAVVLKPNRENIKINSSKESATLLFKTPKISVVITKEPFQISYYNKKEIPIVSEKAGYVKNDSLETIQFNLTKNEILYGGGARALGMNRRGHRLQLYNRAHYGYETHSELMNYTMPIVLSSKQYIVHFDNAPIGFLDLDSNADNTLTYETISGRKTYQVIVGDSWYDLIDNYTDLTGKQPMLPRWALGNFASRFGYHSQKEVEATIDKYIEEDIPVDAVILDLYWFGKDIRGTMGNLEVFRDSFPDFEGMVKRLKTKGVKTIPITEPFVLTTSKRWDEAVKANVLAKDSAGEPYRYDFYFGNTGLIDIYNPKGEKWFWNIYKGLAEKGIAGIWGDLGEPEVHPSDLQHYKGSADEMHNIYGHDWARLIYEGYRKHFPLQRPFILMRAGYSGSQRYGMVPWSGDVNRTWGGLQSQPEIAMQMAMQGLAYMHSDLGGFAGANLDDELYVRWLQYGVFNPIFRPHAQEEVPSEPVFRNEKAKNLAREAIKLRYKLLPYNYNLVYENNKKGKPLMRPLFFEESDNQELYNYSKTYLWGNDILVSPVLEAEIKEQEVYFPRTSVWFDFYSDKKIKGGQKKIISLKENSIPTYIRAGAFIPMERKDTQNTVEFSRRNLEVHYYHDESIKENQRSIYDDKSYNNEYTLEHDYMFNHFSSTFNNKQLKISLNAELGKESEFSSKVSLLVIHGISKEPKRVAINGKKAGYQFEDNKLTIAIRYINQERKKEIKIKL